MVEKLATHRNRNTSDRNWKRQLSIRSQGQLDHRLLQSYSISTGDECTRSGSEGALQCRDD